MSPRLPTTPAAAPRAGGDAFVRLLDELSLQPFVYVPNPGNAGDALIDCATMQVFRRAGLRFERLPLDAPVQSTAGRVVVYGGGGNLVPLYRAASGFIARHAPAARRFIVLPHTVRGHEKLLAGLGENTLICCRDEESFAHVFRHASEARSVLCHDMALHLAPDELLDHGWRSFGLLGARQGFLWKNIKRALKSGRHARVGASRRHLVAFREDAEARHGVGERNIDVSHVFGPDGFSEIASVEASYRMAAFLQRFDEVSTDRLHVGILASLLGKPTRFHDNSYGKNRAVYEYSLRARFPRLVWSDPS